VEVNKCRTKFDSILSPAEQKCADTQCQRDKDVDERLDRLEHHAEKTTFCFKQIMRILGIKE
jgi:hypothetical protein